MFAALVRARDVAFVEWGRDGTDGETSVRRGLAETLDRGGTELIDAGVPDRANFESGEGECPRDVENLIQVLGNFIGDDASAIHIRSFFRVCASVETNRHTPLREELLRLTDAILAIVKDRRDENRVGVPKRESFVKVT